jgi:hypothetical protein
MEVKTLSMMQSLFGAIITCLAVFIFMNINVYSALPIEAQLPIIWTFVALTIFIFGVLQLANGLIEMYGGEKDGK